MVTSLSIWLIVCPHLKHSYHVHRFNGILIFIFLTGAVHKSMSQPEPSHTDSSITCIHLHHRPGMGHVV